MELRRKWVSSVIWFVALVMMLGMLVPSTAFAAGEQGKTVRVAYVIASGYQEGGEGEYKTGYGYEYLQRIAVVTGWKYEYVYGSFGELLEKLENGEVDLMGNLSYTDERAEKISYGTYEQGKESYFLYINHKHSTINSSDYSTINGKKIGIGAGTHQEKLWETWCEEQGIHCEIVEYTASTDRKKAENCKCKLDTRTVKISS